MGGLFVIDHPLVQAKVTMLRDINTGNKEFRELVNELAAILFYEATRDAVLCDVDVVTPICEAKGKAVGTKYAVVPILRAGLGLVGGMVDMLPTIKVGHIGMYRDPETLTPVEYYCKLPEDCKTRETFVIDPMLATGNTAAAALKYLTKQGVKRLKLLCLVGCPQGVSRVRESFPDVDIYAAAMDSHLNGHGYIVPGLGDAGDRLFGTK